MYIVHVYIMHYVTYAGLYAIVLHCVQFGILSVILVQCVYFVVIFPMDKLRAGFPICEARSVATIFSCLIRLGQFGLEFKEYLGNLQ